MTLKISTSGNWADTPLRRFRWMTAATRYMDEAGVLVRTRLKEEAPVKTGRLQRSIRYSRRTTPNVVRGEFKAHTPYAGFVIDGTKPHTIAAKAARSLHWRTGGTDHFALRVSHPGTKPNPFNVRAVEPLRPVLARMFRESVRRAMK